MPVSRRRVPKPDLNFRSMENGKRAKARARHHAQVRADQAAGLEWRRRRKTITGAPRCARGGPA